MPRGARLEDLTWPPATARLDAGAVVVVPIGAIANAEKGQAVLAEMARELVAGIRTIHPGSAA
jgi:creatinine amidohydrolase/Fe(II)-dependent formamide hydrolase-like protein